MHEEWDSFDLYTNEAQRNRACVDYFLNKVEEGGLGALGPPELNHLYEVIDDQGRIDRAVQYYDDQHPSPTDAPTQPTTSRQNQEDPHISPTDHDPQVTRPPANDSTSSLTERSAQSRPLREPGQLTALPVAREGGFDFQTMTHYPTLWRCHLDATDGAAFISGMHELIAALYILERNEGGLRQAIVAAGDAPETALRMIQQNRQSNQDRLQLYRDATIHEGSSNRDAYNSIKSIQGHLGQNQKVIPVISAYFQSKVGAVKAVMAGEGENVLAPIFKHDERVQLLLLKIAEIRTAERDARTELNQLRVLLGASVIAHLLADERVPSHDWMRNRIVGDINVAEGCILNGVLTEISAYHDTLLNRLKEGSSFDLSFAEAEIARDQNSSEEPTRQLALSLYARAVELLNRSPSFCLATESLMEGLITVKADEADILY